MDKGKKLKNYSDKNYAEIISFPVELVGRDGVVRRYSYEDSIRIYRRRIDSAHLRYQDKDIIRAEVHHCSRRMDQIQRSWHQRIHSSERHYIEHRPDPAEREPYEQGKAFLQSYMGGLQGQVGLPPEPGPNLVLLTEVAPCRVFYVNHAGFRAGTLLYVFDLTSSVDDGEVDGQRAFEEYLELLTSCSDAPDVEKLIHEERSDTYGFILTNPHPDIRAGALTPPRRRSHSQRSPEVHVTDRGSFLAWLDGMLHDAGIPDGSSLKPILNTMGAGDLNAAFDMCKDAVGQSPYNQRAYWIMGALSEILGRWEETDAYMVMACHYFPGDAQAQLLAGLHRLRLGAPDDALAHLKEARVANPELPCLHALMVRAYGATGDLPRAKAILSEGRHLHPDDSELQMLEANFGQLQKWQRNALLAAVGLTLSAMLISLTYPGRYTLQLMAVVVAGLAGLFYFHRRRERFWFEGLD